MDIAIKGNSKMGKKVYLFNLPPKKTCTPTEWCLHGKDGYPSCYALRGNFKLPNAVNSAKERLEISKKEDFANKMSEFVNKKKVKYFRIHSSGDFYSNEYVEKWINIAKNCPDTKFRGTTHRKDLIEKIEELNSLPNVIIRESLDHSKRKPVTNLKFAALSNLEIVSGEDSFHCPNKCEPCGYHCWENEVNIHFDEH